MVNPTNTTDSMAQEILEKQYECCHFLGDFVLGSDSDLNIILSRNITKSGIDSDEIF